jgi:uncharacterized protein YdcH (DUF465 family)
MESSDHELIKKVLKTNFELKKLYEEHMTLETELEKFENRGFLLPQEEVEAKSLKLRKLRGVDRMMEIISAH